MTAQHIQSPFHNKDILQALQQAGLKACNAKFKEIEDWATPLLRNLTASTHTVWDQTALPNYANEHVAYLSKDLDNTLRLFTECFPYHASFAPQATKEQQDAMNKRFLGLQVVLKEFDVNISDIISPTGRDLWMHACLRHLSSQSPATNQDRALVHMLIQMKFPPSLRLDRDGDGMWKFLCEFGTIDKSSFIEAINDHVSPDFWVALYRQKEAQDSQYMRKSAINRAKVDQIIDAHGLRHVLLEEICPSSRATRVAKM